MTTADICWTRVRIHGRLECKAPLHIGDGGQGAFDERHYRPDQSKEIPGLYNSVCRDAKGRPYIPGSTLRGWLAARLQRPGSREPADSTLAEMARHLFGEAASETGHAGRLRCYDARFRSDPSDTKLPLWDKERHTQVQHAVKLHPRLGTVDGRTLHRQEAVPAGTEFDWLIEAHDCTESQLALLIGLLESLDGEAGSSLGRGVSRQAGRLRWHGDRIEVLEPEAVANWLNQPGKPLQDAFSTLPQWPDSAALPERQETSVRFRLIPQGLLLVNEPGLCAPTDKSLAAQTDADELARTGAPNLEFSRTPAGHALIPASSLRGLLRACARRIVATIAAGQLAADSASLEQRQILENHIDTTADHLTGALFGMSARRSRIWMTEAISIEPAPILEQTFVAIDRFTGGGQPHKLYKVRAAESGPLEGSLLLDPRNGPLAMWETGLLLLLARDALEGELMLGWGKARGYGACEVEFILEDTPHVQDFDGLLAALQMHRNKADECICALHDLVSDCLPVERVVHEAANTSVPTTAAAEVRHA